MHQKKSLVRALAAALAITAFSAGTAMAAPTLSVTGASTVSVGSAWTVQVRAADVNDLYGYQFDLHFDASKFQAQGVTAGGFLQSGGPTFFDGGVVDNAAGSISFVFDTLLGDVPGVSGDGVLAEFSFTALGIGAGLFSLTNVLAVDASLGDIAVGTESLSVNAVPEPATLALCLAGLGAALLLGRARREGAPAPMTA